MRPLPPLVVLVLLAGCAAPADAPTPEAPGAPETRAASVLEIALEGCAAAEVEVRVPPATLRPFVPPEFEVAEENGQASAALRGFACEDGQAAGAFAIRVTPTRDDLLHEDVLAYWWAAELHLAPDANLTQLYRALGANDTRASTIAVAAGPPATLAIESEAGRHHATLAGATAVPSTPFTYHPTWRQYAPAEGGFVYLQANLVPQGAASYGVMPATVETAEGTPAREALGPQARGVGDLMTRGTLADALLGYVPG